MRDLKALEEAYLKAMREGFRAEQVLAEARRAEGRAETAVRFAQDSLSDAFKALKDACEEA